MSDGTINFPERSTPPDSPSVNRYKIWIDSSGKPRITDQNGVTLGFESIYGSSFSSGDREGLQSNNTTTFQSYLSVPYTINDLSASAQYQLEVNFIYNYSSAANDYVGALFVNGSQFKEDFVCEPRDGGTDQRFWISFKYKILGSELATLTGTIDWQFRSSSNGSTSRTYYCYLTLKRVV